ncbi:hypothetical protein, partial [Oharaeibacter diazotrophicus]
MRVAYDTSTSPERGRLRREWTAVLGMLAVTLNVVLGLLFADRPAAAAAAFDPFVICTSTGGTVPSAPPVGGFHDGAIHCVFCLPLMQGDAVAGAADGVGLRNALGTDLAFAAAPAPRH